MVIVGAGEAGARAAITLREVGWRGPITLIGDEMEPPYERPPLSKTVITSVHEPTPTAICDRERLAEERITFLGGAAAAEIDRVAHEVRLADGRSLPYERLLIATGARPRRLDIPGCAVLLYLRSFADAQYLRARLRPGIRVGVIGGGFIGLELAASATARGCTVTVVELASRVMARAVPEAVASIIAARHEEAGVRLLCGVSVKRIEASDGASRIVLSTGASVDCDVAIAGIGAVPDTRLAEAAGLEIENGICVDSTMKTSDPTIFAAGDCCSFPHPLFGNRRVRLEAWRNAKDQGGLAARNMLGAEAEYATPPWFWSDQYELCLQIAGLPDAGETEVLRRREDGVEIHFGLDGVGRLVAASGVGQGNAVAKDIRLAEMLITRRSAPDRAMLSDPSIGLKKLLSM